MSARTRLVLELGIVGLGTLLIVSLLRPTLWFVNTLPAGGDLSSHVWGADALRRTILPSASGWSWDWLAGFPAFVLYPVLPFLGIVALHVMLPYGVAMKLVIVAGVVTLPLAAWAMGRLWRLPFPTPALLGVASVAFLLQTNADRTGGNLESTIRGEFAYTLGLTATVVALGLMGAAATRDRWRVVTPIAVAVAALCHPLTGELVVVGGLAILAVAAIDGVVAVRRLGPPLAIGLALTGFWWLPFLADRGWMTSPDFRRTTGLHALLPYGWFEVALVPLAVAGVVLAWQERRRLVAALAAVAVIHGLLYLVLPTGQVENLRMVSAWAWPRLALVAIGVAELVPLARERWRAHERRLSVGIPAVAALAVLVPAAAIWHAPPFGDAHGRPYGTEVRVALEGYQRNPQYPRFKALMDTMASLGRTRGCGRFFWSVDYTEAGSDFGTVSNQLAPYYTKGCIQSVPGLYLDSSATTPFEQLTESLTGIAPAPFVPGLPYRRLDLSAGARHLRYLGVRYFATQNSKVAAAIDGDISDFHALRTSGYWHVYEVKGWSLVTSLKLAPVVLKVPGISWAKGSVEYTEGGRPWDTDTLAQSGPDEWSRLEGSTGAKAVPLDPVNVSRVHLTDHGLRFHVDHTGVPVLVHASYFPGWKVEGGHGPWRLAGNMMAVIPTAKDVTMHQSEGPIGLLGQLVSLAGLAGLAVLAQRTWDERHPRPEASA